MPRAKNMMADVVRKVVDPGLLDQEDQAALREKQMDARGSIKILDGHLTKLRGRIMRANALLNPESIKAELIKLRDETNQVIGTIDLIAS